LVVLLDTGEIMAYTYIDTLYFLYIKIYAWSASDLKVEASITEECAGEQSALAVS
jgi:hypothetical protein